MSNAKAGAIALIAGSIASIMLMLVHPLHVGPELVGAVTLNGLMHGTALIATPVLVFGFFAMWRVLSIDRAQIGIGFSFYAFGSVAIVSAATVDRLVAPYLVDAQQGMDAAAVAQIAPLGRLAHWLNQGFAHVYTGLVAVALMLWSAGWPARGAGGQALRAWGVIVGADVLYSQLFGGLVRNVHGMGAVRYCSRAGPSSSRWR